MAIRARAVAHGIERLALADAQTHNSSDPGRVPELHEGGLAPEDIGTDLLTKTRPIRRLFGNYRASARVTDPGLSITPIMRVDPRCGLEDRQQ